MTFTAKVDIDSALTGLDNLPKVANSLLRSMLVAGGQLMRDEAKARAPVRTAEGGSITPGLLRSSIYLAYRDGISTEQRVVYSISWNSRIAPHGHLLEFGHWMTHVSYKGPDGEWHGTNKLLASPKWVAARPFLRPANDAAGKRAVDAMLERGRTRLPELLAEAQP